LRAEAGGLYPSEKKQEKGFSPEKKKKSVGRGCLYSDIKGGERTGVFLWEGGGDLARKT